jgi:hypothetical protein
MADFKPTVAAEFHHMPVHDHFMMQVQAGRDSFLALSQAGALESAVHTELEQAVQEGMSGSLAFLCAFALEAAAALRQAAEASA